MYGFSFLGKIGLIRGEIEPIYLNMQYPNSFGFVFS